MSNGIEKIGLALWGERWQSEMARALGVSRDSIQDWKNGRMNPRPGVYADLLRIAEDRHVQVGGVVKALRQIVARMPIQQRHFTPAPEPEPDDDMDQDHGPEMR